MSCTGNDSCNFLCTPLCDKSVHCVPGVDACLTNKLNEIGVYKASQMVGMLLYLNRHDGAFQQWLIEKSCICAEQACLIASVLQCWIDKNMGSCA
ncbi:hypothetical protein SNEBB_004806 [Seison nebaliae]|nr:hypothetical protein SNEBB_004806 [Seison nebaliae]